MHFSLCFLKKPRGLGWGVDVVHSRDLPRSAIWCSRVRIRIIASEWDSDFLAVYAFPCLFLSPPRLLDR